jgi:hypothetical protein
LSGGAVNGIIFLALEDRFKATVLAFGGLRTFKIPRPEVDHINFAPRVRVPLLMINSQNDPLFPFETSQLPMYRLLDTSPKDKCHIPYRVPGHPVPLEMFEKEMLSWLDRYLGKVK